MQESLAFDWDDAKAPSNLAKHGVSFQYASRVFLDENVADFDTSRPEDSEPRRKAMGMIEGRIFTVVYTKRDGLVRIISARRSNMKDGK